MTDTMRSATAAVHALAVYVVARLSIAVTGDDRGEGVISTAIAVLVMSFIGALMWVGFRGIWTTASNQTSKQVSNIGR